jgi:hypothetical protein
MLDVLTNLKVGQKITVIQGAMPSAETVTVSQHVKVLADGEQWKVQVIFRRPRKRKDEGFTVKFNSDQIAIYEGEVKSTESIWNVSKSETGFIVKEMKHAMFDPRLFRILVSGISQKPLVLIDNRPTNIDE